MIDEKKAKIFIMSGLILALLLAYYIGIIFGAAYLIVFLVALFLVSLFGFFELYLRIQHNIDRAVAETKEQKEILKEAVDFLENLIFFLENDADKNDLNFKELDCNFRRIDGRIEGIDVLLQELKRDSEKNKNVVIEKILEINKSKRAPGEEHEY